jgi:vesicle-fusing ATPase
MQGRRLLILATSSARPILTDLGVADVFDSDHTIPQIRDLDSLEYVLREVELFQSDRSLQEAMSLLMEGGFEGPDEYSSKSVGIKRLLSIIEMARQEPDNVAQRLASGLLGLGM